eukprot:3707229-Amphidinium_carterae.1
MEHDMVWSPQHHGKLGVRLPMLAQSDECSPRFEMAKNLLYGHWGKDALTLGFWKATPSQCFPAMEYNVDHGSVRTLSTTPCLEWFSDPYGTMTWAALPIATTIRATRLMPSSDVDSENKTTLRDDCRSGNKSGLTKIANHI